MISNLCLVPQTEESVAEEEVLGEEWVPNHLARHGKTPHPTVLLGQLHERLRPRPTPTTCMRSSALHLHFQQLIKRGTQYLILGFFSFLFFILKFLHEESNGQSGQSKQQRRRKRRRRSMRKRMTERRVLAGGGGVFCQPLCFSFDRVMSSLLNVNS